MESVDGPGGKSRTNLNAQLVKVQIEVQGRRAFVFRSGPTRPFRIKAPMNATSGRDSAYS